MDSQERPKARSLRPLATLWPFIRPHGTLLLASLLTGLAALIRRKQLAGKG